VTSGNVALVHSTVVDSTEIRSIW